MAKSSSLKTFSKGDIIFKQGQEGSCAYLLEVGSVEIRVENKGIVTAVASLAEGDIFGEMAIVDDKIRSATAYATTECELLEVSKDQLNERVDEADPIVRFLITILMDRLRGQLGVMTQKERDATHSRVVNLNEFKKKAEVIEKIKFEKSMEAALDNDEFEMHYQPILDFQTKRVAGFEALMRWDSPERGMVRPDIFMGVAEETSLIIPLGQWLVKRVVRDFARLKAEIHDAGVDTGKLFMSINIAAKQFNDPQLFAILVNEIHKHKISPNEIKLEITERVLIGGATVFDWIKKARSFGFSVALDDFGTGFSSLSYLANLEVNSLKIDKSFVEKIHTDTKTRNIVKFLVNLSKSLDLTVIAEGVETEQEWDTLKEFGCDYMQGYYFSKAQPMRKIVGMMIPNRRKKVA